MSERILLSPETLPETVEKAAAVLRRDGVILYPTDTLYGLGADAFSDEAVDNVVAMKSRDQGKAIHCVVADLMMAERYAEIGNDARLLAQTFLPGPLTLVLPKKKEFDTGIGRHRDTLGIRIPNNDFCLALARRLDAPFTTTSANVSGAPDVFSVDDILMQLGTEANAIDLIVDAGAMVPHLASTVVDLSGEQIMILRERAIPAADIWNVIRAES